MVMLTGSYCAYIKGQSLEQISQEARGNLRETRQTLQEMQRLLQEVPEGQGAQRELDSDKDHDGLSLREEIKLGTDPHNIDTDADGISDYYDTNPTGGSHNIVRILQWSYADQDWEVVVKIDSDLYDYYKNKRGKIGFGSKRSITTSEMLDHPTMKAVGDHILSIAETQGFNPVGMAVSLVQQLPYIHDNNTGYDSYEKYPIEMIIDQNGDCEDSSFLASSILEAMGYDTVLLKYPNHIALGVWCPNCSGSYYDYEGRKYYYYETTSPNWDLGQMPRRLEQETPNIIQINGQNGKPATNHTS